MPREGPRLHHGPMKRAAAVALWVFAFWYLGSAIAFYLGISDLFGPFLGVAAGALVGIDPRRVIWTKSAASSGAGARIVERV